MTIPSVQGARALWINLPFRLARLLPLAVLLLLGPVLAGCSFGTFGAHVPHSPRLLRVAAIFPVSGVDGPLGRALQRGVVLTVRRHARLARGYRVVIISLDEATTSATRIDKLLRNQHVLAIVDFLDNPHGHALLPPIEDRHITTVSLSETLLGTVPAGQVGRPTQPSITVQHPGAPATLFRLSPSGSAAAHAAADLAVESAPGLAAQTVYLTDDGTQSGRSSVSAFAAELRRKGGIVAGQQSITPEIPTSVQQTVSAIIEADPNLVVYAGGTAAGAALRRTLSLTGAPELHLLTVGPIADHPGWSTAVGLRTASAYTLGLLPQRGLAELHQLGWFPSIYHRAFPGRALLPQTVLAYDAAMDELNAMKMLIREGRPVTRTSVRSIVASTAYPGITGTLAFDGAGNDVTPVKFALYACDSNGTWHYLRTVK